MSARKQSPPQHDNLADLPDNPRDLRRYLSAVVLPQQGVTPPTQEEVKLLNQVLRNHRPGTWQRRELAQLIRGLSVAFLVHTTLLIVALSTVVDDSPVKREQDNEERFVRPIWIQEEPKEEKKPSPPALEKTEEAPDELVLAKAPAPKAPLEKPKPKRKIKKKKTVQKKEPILPKKSVAVVTSEASEAPTSNVKTVDDGATGNDAPQEAESAPSREVFAESGKTGDALPADGPQVDLDGLRKDYMGQLNSRFQKERIYPRTARRAGIQGTVLLEVTINSRGLIVETRVIQSSGHSILDAAAVKAVKGVDDLPAPPKDLGWSRRSMKIPFVYRLS